MQDGSTLVVGGKTNRAKLEFPQEMNRLLDKVPEIVGSADTSFNLINHPRTVDSSLPEQSESVGGQL